VIRAEALLLHLLHHVLGNRPRVRIRCAAGDEEEVRHVGHAAQIEQNDVEGFGVEGDLRGALHELERVGCRGCRGRRGSVRWHEVGLGAP
jgi:hypothetical protein